MRARIYYHNKLRLSIPKTTIYSYALDIFYHRVYTVAAKIRKAVKSMESIVATLTTLFNTLIGYIKEIAVQVGVSGYLDSILAIFGLGGEEEAAA